MKRLLTLIFATISLTPICATQYFGLDLGTNQSILTNQSDKGLKMGVRSGVKYGYIFDSGIRAEAEVTYRQNHFKTVYNIIDKDQIGSKEYKTNHSWSYMLNVMYDIVQLNMSQIVPYIGVGIGYCANTEKNKVKYDEKSQEDKMKEDRFSYQGIIGCKYPIQNDLATGIEYRYFTGKSHQKDHSVGLFVIRGF